MKSRKKHSAGFKAQVALEAIREQKTLNELAGEYKLHPNMISKWKKELLEKASIAFSEGRGKDDREREATEEALYQQIGKLQVQLEWLKKKTNMM